MAILDHAVEALVDAADVALNVPNKIEPLTDLLTQSCLADIVLGDMESMSREPASAMNDCTRSRYHVGLGYSRSIVATNANAAFVTMTS